MMRIEAVWLSAVPQYSVPRSVRIRMMPMPCSAKKGCTQLTRYLDDGNVPIDNNWIENRIRPITLGRNNWLFAGSLRAGQRAAAIMSLIQSAKLNGHDPYAYLKDVLQRMPTQPPVAEGVMCYSAREC